MTDVDNVPWQEEFDVDGQSVRVWLHHDINNGTNFDIWVEYEGVCYVSTVYGPNDIQRWYAEVDGKVYFCDPSFIFLREMGEKEVELAVLDIIRSGKIGSFFEPEDQEVV
jgi:hypothetical protein